MSLQTRTRWLTPRMSNSRLTGVVIRALLLAGSTASSSVYPTKRSRSHEDSSSGRGLEVRTVSLVEDLVERYELAVLAGSGRPECQRLAGLAADPRCLAGPARGGHPLGPVLGNRARPGRLGAQDPRHQAGGAHARGENEQAVQDRLEARIVGHRRRRQGHRQGNVDAVALAPGPIEHERSA